MYENLRMVRGSEIISASPEMIGSELVHSVAPRSFGEIMPRPYTSGGHLSNANTGLVGSSLRVPQIDAVLNEQQMSTGNLYPLPNSFTVSVASAAGGATTRVYLLNQDRLNNIVTNGATAITYTYTDGFQGKNISYAVSNARAGVGALCYGCQLTFNITSTGAADVAGLNNANAYWATFDPATGQPITDIVNTAANQSRSDTNFALSVDLGVVNLSAMKQLSFLLSSGSTATATFYLTSDFRL